MPHATDMLTGRAKESGHWYDEKGNLVYQIRGKNGQLRPPTLRDARPLGLKVGTTTVLGVEYKHQLEKWKRKQCILSARTLPGLDAVEDEDQLIALVEADANEQARKAAARGTHIHAAIQGAFEGKPIAAEDLPYVEPVRAWLKQRYGLDGWLAETSFASPMGYGGKTDLHHPTIPCVIDFKGKDFDAAKTGLDLGWPDNAMQLAAYRQGLDIPRADCVNIFFSRTIPGLIRVREWDESEIQENWEAFQHLLAVWKIRNRYDPSFSREKAA